MKRKPFGIIILVAILIAGGFGLWYWLANPTKPEGSEQPATATVEKKTIEDIIEVSGHLKAREEQEIRSPVAGMIITVQVQAGQKVEKGTPIAALDSFEQEQILADLAFQIDQERFAGNLRKIALLEGKVAVQRRTLDELTIKAHLDGKVSRLDLKPGDILKAGDSYGRIIDVSSLTAVVEIAEMDIPRTKVGQAVEFRFPAIPGLVVRGRIASFPAEARINDRGLTVLDARLIIDSPPQELLPAYSFQAIIKVGPPREILVVASQAVSYQAGLPMVERQKPDGLWEKVPVETEGFGSSMVRIVSGCTAGDILKLQLPGEKVAM